MKLDAEVDEGDTCVVVSTATVVAGTEELEAVRFCGKLVVVSYVGGIVVVVVRSEDSKAEIVADGLVEDILASDSEAVDDGEIDGDDDDDE